MVTGFGGERGRLIGNLERLVQLSQPHARDAGPTDPCGALQAVQARRLRRPGEFPQRLGRASGQQQCLPEQRERRRVHAGVVRAAEELTELALSVDHLSGVHQRGGPVREQPITPSIAGCHQRQAPAEQIDRGLGRGAGCLAGGGQKPMNGRLVTLRSAAAQMLGHLASSGAGCGQPLTGLAVHRDSHAPRQLGVDRITDQVVTKAQPGAVVGKHPGGDRFLHSHGQFHRGLLGDHRQLGQRETRAEHRSHPKRPHRRLGQKGEPPQDRDGEGVRHAAPDEFAFPVSGDERAFLSECGEQLRDEQRIAARARDLVEQIRGGSGRRRICDQLRDGAGQTAPEG